MTARYLPTVAEVAQVIADAQAYWEAEDVELFLFGSIADQASDAELFADEVSPLAHAA